MEIQMIGSSRFYIIKGDIVSPIEIDRDTLIKLVGYVKYPNNEHKTKGTRKGDRSFAAVCHITDTLLNGNNSVTMNAKEIFREVSNYDGRTHLARIYPLGYNKHTDSWSHDRIRRSRRAFYKLWAVLNGTYREERKP